MQKISNHVFSQSGYVLFLMMLLIGSLSLYLMYEMGTQKIKIQSWQVQKTATEMSYWMDIERNYVMDNGINTDTSAGQDQMNALTLPNMIANNYLPYGQYRPVTFQSSAIPQVSEFLCSPLPGVNADEGVLTYAGGTTCPTTDVGYTAQHCSLDTLAYYSCGNTMADASKLPVNMRKAQYYINTNYIALGNDSSILAGVGLILRTPGAANAYVTYSNNGGGIMGQLPQGSTAQSLMTLLPTSSFNVYTTTVPGVNDIGIASYVYTPLGSGGSGSSTVIKNDRYSKIIDMGLVQSTFTFSGTCCGWTGDKKGSTGLYNGNQDKNGYNQPISDCKTGGSGSLMKNSSGPPTCIKINLKEYGPTGTIEKCNRIDVLYTPFDTAQKPTKDSTSAGVWYMDYTPSWGGQDSNYSYVAPGTKENYTSPGGKPAAQYNFSDKKNMNDFFIYFVRCTRNPP